MPEPDSGETAAIVAYVPFNRRALAAVAVTASLAAACLPPAGASAEVPSVDAYGGQALVLGKPRPPRGSSHHRDSANSRSPASSQLSSRESAHSSYRAPSGTTVPVQAGGTEKSARSSAGHGRLAQKRAAGRRTSNKAGSGNQASNAPVAGGEATVTATLARETQPVGLSGSDLALLLAIALGLVLSGVAVRALSRRPG